MRDTMYLGSTPPEEDCAQVGSEGYYDRARRECQIYRDLLRRTLGLEPDGASLVITRHPHDFGDYLAVEVRFDPEVEQAAKYAFQCEANGPLCWDDLARQQLAQPPSRKEMP